MNWYRYIDWGPVGLIGAIITGATILIVAPQSHFPAEVVVRECGDATVEKYAMPKGYRYHSSSIVVTGNVATVTATFKKETTK